MNRPKSSFILSPNLGCPEIVSPQEAREAGFCVVLAIPTSEGFDPSLHALEALPSFNGEGSKFVLEISDPQKLEDEGLPLSFRDTADTRRLVSTTLRTGFPDHTFWAMRARPKYEITREHFRTADRPPTLYDLTLSVNGVAVACAQHALCLRTDDSTVKFVHLTDLHLAARNDLWQREVPAVIENSPVTPGPQNFQNFNDRFREFIRWANRAADDGELDFIWALGDLVDFCRTGLFDRIEGDSNWSTFIEMVTGSAAEVQRGNPGLRVPMFTTTGNHDWRTYPYSPAFRLGIFGITKQCADELDLWYRNTSVQVGKKLEEVNQRLIRKGSPLLARSWWGAIASMGWRGLTVGIARLGQRAKAFIVSYGRQLLWLVFGGTSITTTLKQPWLALLLLALVALATLLLPSALYAKLRTTLESLIAIEADISSLDEYFLRINPYLNYAFEVGNCAFIVLDTGPDCLTAQSFWDDGGKKVRNISIDDNILGGSPDTMGFYPSNEFYPYSQITWLENVLASIESRGHGEAPFRVFVGLHAPVANLSIPKRHHADEELQRNEPKQHYLLMKEGWLGYDIRYGTVNHYLSQFFYLCLGCREAAPDERFGPGVDAVFSGHAHWNMEFKLQKPGDAGSRWSPQIFYGNFSQEVEAGCADANAKWGPLLLQTAACGPQGKMKTEVPPNFRYVTVDGNGGVCNLRPLNLRPASARVNRAAAPH